MLNQDKTPEVPSEGFQTCRTTPHPAWPHRSPPSQALISQLGASIPQNFTKGK